MHIEVGEPALCIMRISTVYVDRLVDVGIAPDWAVVLELISAMIKHESIS